MIKKDFMKEIENSLKIVKREVDKNIINGDISKAKEAINNQLKGLVGLDIMTIDTLSFSSVIDIISREDEFNGEKYIKLLGNCFVYKVLYVKVQEMKKVKLDII